MNVILIYYFPALLEKPLVPSPWNPGEFNYKIFVSGRSGVGKTSTVAKLSANPVPQSHSETPGEFLNCNRSSFPLLYWFSKKLQ